MKFPVLIAAVLAAASAVSYKDALNQEYDLYKVKYNKSYSNPLENYLRFDRYVQDKFFIAQHNIKFLRGESTYTMGINQFSDWFQDEIDQINGFNRNLRERAAAGEDVNFDYLDAELHVTTKQNLPDSVNWVEEGAVTSVKDQRDCGCCYAFSSIAALESQHYIRSKQLVELSEQQIIDCSGEFGNFGCDGGQITNVYDYIKRVGGVNTASSYPYQDSADTCRYNQANNAATCSSYVKVEMSEDALKDAVASAGPITISIHARARMHKYTGGVYSDPECRSDVASLNHAMVVVGYGTDTSTNQDYWLVKNSWGSAWGENGYIRIARNQNNMCGIATYAIYPRI